MAALLAVAMVCAMAIPAFAAGTGSNTLTINGKTAGHTYEAYQVFTGDLKGSVLSNIVWGDGVDGDGILNDTGLPSSLRGSLLRLHLLLSSPNCPLALTKSTLLPRSSASTSLQLSTLLLNLIQLIPLTTCPMATTSSRTQLFLCLLVQPTAVIC